MQVFTAIEASRNLAALALGIASKLVESPCLAWDNATGELRIMPKAEVVDQVQLVFDTRQALGLLGDGKLQWSRINSIASQLTRALREHTPVGIEMLEGCTDPDHLHAVLTDAFRWPDLVGQANDLRQTLALITERPHTAFTWRVGQDKSSLSLHTEIVVGNGLHSMGLIGDVVSPWRQGDVPLSRPHLRRLWAKWPMVSLNRGPGATYQPQGALAVVFARAMWLAYMETELIDYLFELHREPPA